MVRIQLLRTRESTTAAEWPSRASRPCNGTCTKNVESQITAMSARPSKAAPRPTPAGGQAATATAVASSTAMNGITTGLVRRWFSIACSRDPAPVIVANSG
jgi:hypothetical protein